jgi:hypothetical protein
MDSIVSERETLRRGACSQKEARMCEPFFRSAGTENVSSDTSAQRGTWGSMGSGRVTHEIPYRAQDRAVSTFGDAG